MSTATQYFRTAEIEGDRFRVVDVDAGRYRVRVYSYEDPVLAGEWFDLTAGAVVDVGVLETEASGSLTVRLAPALVEGARVGLRSADRTYYSLERGEHGYRRTGITPGAYWLWAAADGHVAGQRLVEIRPGESAEFDLELVASCAVPIELELPVPTETWRAIEYTVRGQGGEVWVNERLRNYQGRTSPYCRELSLPRGSHTLTIARDGREVGRWPLVVDGAPGPPQRFSLRE